VAFGDSSGKKKEGEKRRKGNASVLARRNERIGWHDARCEIRHGRDNFRGTYRKTTRRCSPLVAAQTMEEEEEERGRGRGEGKLK